jgi:replicative DNA helicase
MFELHNIEMEKKVLGHLIFDKKTFYLYFHRLSLSTFYSPTNQAIFQAMAKVQETEHPSAMVLMHHLDKSTGPKNGWDFYLMSLESGLSDYNLDGQIAILKELEAKRKIEQFAIKLNQQDFTDSSADIFERIESDLRELRNGRIKNSERASEIVADYIKDLESPNPIGIMTNIHAFNKITAGLKPGELIIYAARPGMGKTAKMVADCVHACLAGKKVRIVSAEMTRKELMARIIVLLTNIPFPRIKTRDLQQDDWVKINKAVGIVEKWHLTIDESTRLSDIISNAKSAYHEEPYDLLAVDYIQRISGNKERREQEVNEIAMSFKNLAKEFGIPVIALAQLNRQNESRGDKRPLLADLRESGAIEQEADMVMFLHRPEYYHITELEDGTPSAGMGELVIAKYRSGETGTIVVRWDGMRMKYYDLNQEPVKIEPAGMESAPF